MRFIEYILKYNQFTSFCCPLSVLRWGYTWRLFWRRLTRPFQTTLNLYAYNHKLCLVVLCKFLGILGKMYFFAKDRLNWGKYEMLKIWWICKIEIWSEELIDGYQPPTDLGLSFGVVNCLVVFPTHFNPNNSLLIILQISHPFTCTPRLNAPVVSMISRFSFLGH